MKKQFDAELAQMQRVIDQRLKSEETMRKQNEQKMRADMEKEKKKLEEEMEKIKKAKLETENAAQNASVEEKLKFEKELKQVQAKLDEKLLQRELSSAIEQERSRFLKEQQVFETEKNKNEVEYKNQLKKVEAPSLRPSSSLSSLPPSSSLLLPPSFFLLPPLPSAPTSTSGSASDSPFLVADGRPTGGRTRFSPKAEGTVRKRGVR